MLSQKWKSKKKAHRWSFASNLWINVDYSNKDLFNICDDKFYNNRKSKFHLENSTESDDS